MPPDVRQRPLSGELLRALRAVIDRLVPDDELGPGAVGVGVVGYVERMLAGEHARHRPEYEHGLHGFDECAVRSHGAPLAELEPAQQDEVLRGIETGWSGSPALRSFFERVRIHVMEGMFGDPAWGTNRDGAGWELIGYAGPRAVWSYEEQQLDAMPTVAGEPGSAEAM